MSLQRGTENLREPRCVGAGNLSLATQTLRRSQVSLGFSFHINRKSNMM